MQEAVDEMEDIAGHGLELARHATRGAVHVGEDLTDQVGRIVQGAVLGTVRAWETIHPS